MCTKYSCSLMASSSSSGFSSLMPSGRVSKISWSKESTPMVFNISFCSCWSGPIWRSAKDVVFIEKLVAFKGAKLRNNSGFFVKAC